MEDRQWQSDGPVTRGGHSEPDSLTGSESSHSPDENHNRLMEEAEEVEQGPHGGHHRNGNGDEDEDDSSRVEDEEEEEEEEPDSNSGAFSPEPDRHIQDSPTPTSSPSPTVSEGLVSPEGAPQLTTSLQELQEQGDHPLLPQCLHQIAESFMHDEDYESAVRFIELERLYHQRLLANLSVLQQQWEKRLSSAGRCLDSGEDRDAELEDQHLEKLRHICRTHRQPARSLEKCEVFKGQRNSVIREAAGGEQNLNTQGLSCGSGKVMEDQSTSEAQQEVAHPDGQQLDSAPSLCSATPPSSPPAIEDSGVEEDSVSVPHSHSDDTRDVPEEQQPRTDTVGPGELMDGTGDTVDTGQEPETAPHSKREDGGEEAVKAEEGGAGDGNAPERDVPGNTPEPELEENGNGLDVLNVSMLDDMAKRIQVEEITPAAGLVSILKRRGSLEGENSSTPAVPKPGAKRKVRFREPDEGLDHDEVGGDSWLLLLLLCLATVVISVGGTALYCTFSDAQSTVCTDFSHNMDFYMGRVQRGVDELKHWLSPSS